MRKQKGFSLIELLIVVAIILIIAAIAIPNLLRSRIAANEASAVGSLRTINTAEVTYASTYPGQGFSTDLATLGGADPCTPAQANACLIDSVLSTTGIKSGYQFTFTGDGQVPSVSYTLEAEPQVVNQSGTRGFCTDGSGVVRFVATGGGAGTCAPATATPL